MSEALRYNHACAGCGGSYAACQPLWAEGRKCCPDCNHHKAHPPPGTWRDFPDLRDWYEFELERGAPFDEQLRAPSA